MGTSRMGQKMIAALLGHSDPATTARYTYVQAAEQTSAALVEARWERLVGRG